LLQILNLSQVTWIVFGRYNESHKLSIFHKKSRFKCFISNFMKVSTCGVWVVLE
jgi:hypothetical protein